MNYDVIPSQLKDLFILTVKIHSHNTRSSVSNNFYITESKLNENLFQEFVQNCGMRYQLSSEHYQNSSLKGKFV